MSAQKAIPQPDYPRRPVARVRPIRSYGTGMWAWLLQRVTGVLLVAVVFAHFWAKVLLPTWGTIPQVTDLLLILLVCYHSFSGLRTVLIDLGFGLRARRALFWGTVALGLLTALAALRAYQIRFLV